MSLQSIIGQYALYGAGPAHRQSYDADAQAFFTAAGITDTTQKRAVNQLVYDLKTAQIWTRIVGLYPFVGGTEDAHKYNLKDPRDLDAAFRLSFIGGWTHSDTGALPDGSTGYADTFINLNEHVPQYSFHGSYYARDNAVPVSDYKYFGVRYSSATVELEAFVSNGLFGNAGDAAALITLTGQLNFDKLMMISCYHSNKFNIYRNGASLGSNTNDRTNYFPSIDTENPRTLYMAALNNAGTAEKFNPSECAFASFGYGLDATQVAQLNSAVLTFQTALNRNV